MSEAIDWLSPVVAAAERANPPADGDYLDDEGLLVCGKCHTRRQKIIQIPGAVSTERHELKVMVQCRCRREADEAQKRRWQMEKEMDAVGGNAIVGIKNSSNNSTDRGYASMYSICKNKRIKSIETVSVGGTTYAAVNIDNGGTKFDTVAAETYISTMPWYSGRNDDVLGYDGSHTNYTNGKEPGLIQRTEFQVGAYIILSDELWQWGQDADGNFTLDCYTCHDQSKVTTNGSISGDYTKQEDLTLTFPAGTGDAWNYIEDLAVGNDPAVLWPSKVSTKAGSGTGVKAGMYVAPRTSGVRAAWCVCALYNSGDAGLAARNSNNGTTNSNWNGVVGVPSGYSSSSASKFIAPYIPCVLLKLLETSTAGDGPSQMRIACGGGIGNPLAASSIGAMPRTRKPLRITR